MGNLTQSIPDQDLNHLAELGKGILARVRGEIPDRVRSFVTEEDILQNTYWDAITEFGPAGPGRLPTVTEGWLLTAARNNLRDVIRWLDAAKRGGDWVRAESAPGELASLVEQVAFVTTTPSREAARAAAAPRVHEAIEQLPPLCREAIRAVYLSGLTAAAAARELDCTPGAVLMRVMRGRKLLHDLLGCTSANV
jgi:RNA polymerase sigma factor (sigma-70 family)